MVAITGEALSNKGFAINQDQSLLNRLETLTFPIRNQTNYTKLRQEIKQLFKLRRFNTIFSTKEYLDIYAVEHLPMRALCYRRIFDKVHEIINPIPKSTIKSLNVLCLGAGNGSEAIGIIASRFDPTVVLLQDMSIYSILPDLISDFSKSSTDSITENIGVSGLDLDQNDRAANLEWDHANSLENTELNQREVKKISVSGKTKISQNRTQKILNCNASVGINCGNCVNSLPTKSIPTFRIIDGDLTDLTVLNSLDLKTHECITTMFLLNEILSLSKKSFVQLITYITRELRQGAIWVVVDSAGSFSEFTTSQSSSIASSKKEVKGNENGRNSTMKVLTKQEREDAALLEVSRSSRMLYMLLDNIGCLETLHAENSVWYRPHPALIYPEKLHSMRYFIRIFRKF